MASHAEVNEENVFRCPKCRRVLGYFEDDILIMPNAYAIKYHGVCTNCGYEFIYSNAGKRFERFLEEQKQIRDCETCNSDQDDA